LEVAPETMGLLERYPWPGNVQELRNAVEHAVILASEGRLRPSDLPDRMRESQDGGSSTESRGRVASRRFRDAKREVVESFERAYLCELMEQHEGNVTSAAVQAGMLRSALQRLLRKYGLKSVEFRKRARTGHARVDAAPRVD
jgi:DNA-binding NtrC family response regulator